MDRVGYHLHNNATKGSVVLAQNPAGLQKKTAYLHEQTGGNSL